MKDLTWCHDYLPIYRLVFTPSLPVKHWVISQGTGKAQETLGVKWGDAGNLTEGEVTTKYFLLAHLTPLSPVLPIPEESVLGSTIFLSLARRKQRMPDVDCATRREMSESRPGLILDRTLDRSIRQTLTLFDFASSSFCLRERKWRKRTEAHLSDGEENHSQRWAQVESHVSWETGEQMVAYFEQLSPPVQVKVGMVVVIFSFSLFWGFEQFY